MLFKNCKMVVPLVDHFFCGSSLRTGAIVVCGFEVISAAIVLSVSTSSITFHKRSDEIGFLAIYTMFAIAHIGFSMVLAIGIRMENTRILDVWIWFGLVGYPFYVFLVLSQVVILIMSYRIIAGLITFSASVIFLAFHAYFIVVVNSYLLDLKWQFIEPMTWFEKDT